MSWILEYFVVYLLCVYIYRSMFGWLCRATYCLLVVVSTSLLGVSHAVRNEKKPVSYTHLTLPTIYSV